MIPNIFMLYILKLQANFNAKKNALYHVQNFRYLIVKGEKIPQVTCHLFRYHLTYCDNKKSLVFVVSTKDASLRRTKQSFTMMIIEPNT